MSHQISCYNGVLTVRLEGRVSPQELAQDVRASFDQQTDPVIVILDTTQLPALDATLKSMLYRILQHHSITKVGICGVPAQLQQDVADLVLVLRRLRPTFVSETEADLKSELGLAPQTKKLSGMLAYLKNKETV